GVMAYIPSLDSILYALSVNNGRVQWRYFSGAPIRTKVEVTDRDVYVTPQGEGLACLDRETGRRRWQNKTAQRFLSTDYEVVYAVARLGHLLVLDYERGTTLGQYDSTEYVVPVSNDVNDRLFLANHDGQIICLHHRGQRKPVSTKTYFTERQQE